MRDSGRRRRFGGGGLAALLVVLAACQSALPSATPQPTPGPALSELQAGDAVFAFLVAWRTKNYQVMHDLLAPADRDRYTAYGFTRLHRSFDELVGVERLDVGIGSFRHTARPPEGRDGGQIVEGPVPALAVPVILHFTTSVFGPVDLERTVELTATSDGWQVRWSPSFLFPALAEGGTFSRTRSNPSRGRILAADRTVLAETRPDGLRVYPQDTLAGQTVGTVARLDAAGAAARADAFYTAGDWVGRTGVEHGAEDLLRGFPGFELLAAPYGGEPEPVLDRPIRPGADVTLTIQTDLQRAAERALAPYYEAATAVVDPKGGDIWALASVPALNPNALTTGTTMAGTPLSKPTASQMTNHAVASAYPAGSSFKPFTLAAALQQGVASPATVMPCPGTWTYQGFTFHNYADHTLPGLVDLREAMAFSCNTTYMPLSIEVYRNSHTALTDVVRAFGFGQSTGVGVIEETPGLLPDAAYFEATPRWDGSYIGYNGFDQIQLAIGQGSYLGTQLQLALAYAAFGNGGTLWQARLIESATLPDGTEVPQAPPTIVRQVPIDAANLDFVVSALRAVVTYSYGTATAAFSGFGIPVAGKSGTAETGTPDPDALFPAFAPAADPEIAVATILVHVHLATGGSDSAPLVRRVMAAFFAR